MLGERASQAALLAVGIAAAVLMVQGLLVVMRDPTPQAVATVVATDALMLAAVAGGLWQLRLLTRGLPDLFRFMRALLGTGTAAGAVVMLGHLGLA